MGREKTEAVRAVLRRFQVQSVVFLSKKKKDDLGFIWFLILSGPMQIVLWISKQTAILASSTSHRTWYSSTTADGAPEATELGQLPEMGGTGLFGFVWDAHFWLGHSPMLFLAPLCVCQLPPGLGPSP